MSFAAIVAYKTATVDVEDELRRLGLPCVYRFFRLWHEIVVGRTNVLRLPLILHFRNIPIFSIEDGRRFAIYAVETEEDGGRRVIVITAGQAGLAASGSLAEQDLYSDVLARLSDFLS